MSFFSNYYKTFNTVGSELRQAQAYLGEELEPAPRAKRGYQSLPDPWDDIPRMDTRHRSWKKHRKNQWK